MHAILQASDGRERQNRLINEEKHMICEAVLELHINGTLLCCASVRVLAALLISTFDSKSIEQLRFKNSKPGKKSRA